MGDNEDPCGRPAEQFLTVDEESSIETKNFLLLRNVENRELRAHRRSVDRQNVKDKRLSVLRRLDLTENILQETPLKRPESKNNKEQKKPNRIELLKKWKAEKELRKKLEAKKQKPIFKVSHVKYSPPPVLSRLPWPVSNNKVPKIQTQGVSSMKTSSKYLSNISLRNKGVNKTSKQQTAQQNSSVVALKSATQDVPDLDISSEVSFAPSNFVFAAPTNLTSIVLSIFSDPGTKSENTGVLKRISTTPRKKSDNSEKCALKNMSQGTRNSSEKGLPAIVKDSLFNMPLETISEKVEDCMIETDNIMQRIIEDVIPELDDGLTSVCKTELQLSSISSLDNAEKSKRGKSRKSSTKARGSNNEFSQTPRRSARLSSLSANPPTPLDSRFFVKSERCASPENDDTGILSAGLATFLEDTPQTALSRRLSKLSISHSLTAQQDQEITSRPLTRSQNRISLLGTPQRRMTRSQKIVKDDLITFSPSV